MKEQRFQEQEERPDFGNLAEKLSSHVETRLNYYQLVAVEKIAVAATRATSKILLLSLVMLFAAFLGITGGLLIGRAMNDTVAGFAIVTGVYLLAVLLYLLLRRSVFERKMTDSYIASMLYENDDEDDDDE
jgi:divalent metal cation (Fe/Co/Zn/Cd) transporter